MRYLFNVWHSQNIKASLAVVVLLLNTGSPSDWFKLLDVLSTHDL